MVFLFVASHSTDLVLPCKKDTLCFIENVSFSVPLIILDFFLSDNNDNRNIKEKVNYKKVDKPD